MKPNIHTIPAGVPFVDALAVGILDMVGGDPLAMAAATVLLPTRRACRSLREAFLRHSGGRPLLLPRLGTLGDLDATELSLSAEEVPGLAGQLDLPPAISGLRRQLLMTRMILARGDTRATPDQAARLGADLARFLDQVQTAGLGFAGLDRLVPQDYARHWQITLDFLKILTEVWPAILHEEGAIDAADLRNRLLRAQAEAWRVRSPPGLVIAAGATGAIPATADLMAAVASLDQGMVVLPGLDLLSDDDSWRALDEAHPQYNMARLIERLGVERSQVRNWPANVPGTLPARARLIAEAMRPAATTEGWREIDAHSIDARALDGLHRIDCPGAEDEATVVALIMRHTLKTHGKTAALVTPDRNLARRVAAALKRWGIEIDDSGGRPLADSAVGTYLRLTADFALQRADPLILLALLKHPLAAGGRPIGEFRQLVRALERAVLRGPRPGPGFAGLTAALHQTDPRRLHPEEREMLAGWLDGLGKLAAPFMAAVADEAPLVDLLRRHIAFAEALAANHEEPGPDRLWRHDDGETASRFISELRDAAHGFPIIPGSEYPALFQALLFGRAVRPRFGLQPRLWILGPLEARLQHFDVMILGGLNERTWPPDPTVDPWMSRPMRKTFGLPSPEHDIGLSAHDFTQGACAREVFLTRAERTDGTPTVPSRWLLRLDTVLQAAGPRTQLEREAATWLGWARALDAPDTVRPIDPPRPCPPVGLRPRKLSVTEIETWMRDPYAIYARHVLRLHKLDPIAADPGASERGQFIHKALDGFVRRHPGTLPGNALEELLALGREAFGDTLARPEVWAFWWPRFQRIAEWFIRLERERRPAIRPLATEAGGHMMLDASAGAFTLTAKADRIDRNADGSLGIVDYKTGTPPSVNDLELGFAPQLPLEACMAQAGGFSHVAAAPVTTLAFWRLTGGDPPGEEKTVKSDIAALAESAKAGLEALIEEFDRQETPYWSQPRPDRAPRYTDYAHLARIQEWSAGGSGSGGE